MSELLPIPHLDDDTRRTQPDLPLLLPEEEERPTPPYGVRTVRREPTYPPREPVPPQPTLPLPTDYVTPHFRASEWRCPALYGVPATDYPPEWVSSRLRPLCETLEVIRAAAGGEAITVLWHAGGGYRPKAWNDRHIEAGHGAAPLSQHCEGRAADVRHATMRAHALHALILALHRQGLLPELGGLGLYDSFVHVDVRPHEPGRLALW